jgi:hypothetical protein
MARSIYTKFTGRNRGLSGYTQLWLAPDHLLLVKSSRFSEEYKRFSFADIQSIVITETPSRIVLQVIMILAALAWMALSFAVDSPAGKWAIEISGVLALLIPIIDITRGTRCRCVLHTRVSKEPLAPVSRTRIARNFLAGLRPRIEAVQGAVPEEGVAAQVPDQAWEPPPPEVPNSPGYLPEVLCGTFLINAVLIWMTVKFPQASEIAGVLINTLIAEVLLIVVILVRRKGRDERVIIYALIVLGLFGVAYDAVTITKGIGTWYLTVLDKAKNNDKTITPMFLFVRGSAGPKIASAWRVFIGLGGLVAAFFERRSAKWVR